MLAIVSAMPEEIAGVLAALTDVSVEEHGRRQFHTGLLHGNEAVVVFSRWGKVAAAVTVTQLLASYRITRLIFGGVAGAARQGLAIGDIVVGSELLQHDMDASPLYPRYEVPLLGKASFAVDPVLRERLVSAARAFLTHDLEARIPVQERDFFQITRPKVIEGLIASGDKFFASAAEVKELQQRLPQVCCVEMEGAAVAQVCDEYAIPYAVIRTISDSADENSVHDFPRFSREIARHYLIGVLSRAIT
jgi:adenosylhomocysteine nucleosidase